MAHSRKRDSKEVDRLIAEVDKLTNHPDPDKRLSVNKACQKVGLQTTVYYFRKRKEDALSKLTPGHTVNVSAVQSRRNSDNKDTAALMAEARELEDKLNQIKLKIAESVMKTY